MMIATHDSLTAYPVKSLWLRPFNFLCKCQDKTLKEQYDAGARSFDLRFAKYRGEWYAAHGAMLYGKKLFTALWDLYYLSVGSKEPAYFRVLCEDTFYRGSDLDELEKEVQGWIDASGNLENLKLLYIRSKRDWNKVTEYPANARCADYNVCWDKPFTFQGMERAKSELHALQTTDDRINFIGCYSSKFIPRVTAWILTNFAKAMTWKENDCPVVDFI
jgi:hypothetical protein